MSNARQVTNSLIDLAEQGVISWESIATACLQYMSEADVADMAHSEGFIEESDVNE
jgi:hypothetical protein